MRGFVVAENEELADRALRALEVGGVDVVIGPGRSSTHSLGSSLMVARRKPVVFYFSEPMSSDLAFLLPGRDYISLDSADDPAVINTFFAMPRP